MKLRKIILDIDRGFSFHPFVIIPKWAIEIGNEASYLAHETVHWQRQKSFCRAIVWVIMYFTSKKFRFTEEVIAYSAQLKVQAAKDGQSVDIYYDQGALSLTSGYWGMCTYAEARAALVFDIQADDQTAKRVIK